MVAFSASETSRAQSPSDNEDPAVSIVQAFITAQVQGDYRAARALLAPGATAWYRKKEEAGIPWTVPDDWTAWDNFFHREIVYWDFKPVEGGVIASASENSDFYRLIDRPQQSLKITWWLNIERRLTGVLFESLRVNLKERGRLGEFKEWAKKSVPAELEYLMPNGEADPKGDRPQRFCKLLEEWRRSSGLPPVDLSPRVPK